MKLVVKLLLTVLLLFLFIISLGYAVLRSHWGISAASRWISDATAYHLSIQRFSHDWSHPLTFNLNQVTFGEDGKPALIIADDVALTLGIKQIISPSQFKQVTVQQGSLIMSNLTPETSLPFSAERLQLQAVKLLNPYPTHCLSATRIDATITPWHPTKAAAFGQQFNFQFSAQQVQVGRHSFDQLSASGYKNSQQLQLTHFSGNAARGTFTGQLERNALGQWSIPQLQLDNIRFQTAKSPAELLQPLLTQQVSIGQLSIFHTSILGPDWAINNLTATGQQLYFGGQNDDAVKGALTLKADSIVSGVEQVDQPQVTLTADDQGIRLDAFSADWAKGSVAAQGTWSRQSQQLELNNLTVKDIRYTLPENWRSIWLAPLPQWLSTVNIDKLAIDNMLLIDINDQFPFQMTAAHVAGNALQLVKHHQWGIWRGEAEYYAAAATFNRQDIRAPWFTIHADDSAITLKNFKVLVAEGPAVGDMTIEQSPTRQFSLSLRAEKVPYHALNQWGWPSPLSGQGNLTLDLSGQLAAGQSPLSTLNGELKRVQQGKVIQQNLSHGQLIN